MVSTKNMDDPPPYDESSMLNETHSNNKVRAGKEISWPSIRNEAYVSRSQHVAGVITMLLPQIRLRAQHGLSKSILILIPSDEGHSNERGQLIGYFDEQPMLIHLEGPQNVKEFWAQSEARELLQSQLAGFVSADAPREEAPQEQKKPATSKRSWMSTRKTGDSGIRDVLEKQKSESPVNVQIDEISLRSETEYGLFETRRLQGIIITINVG